MKERPILFSAPMVRAVLAGTKTQTRRVVKPPRGRDSFVVLGMTEDPDKADWWPYQSDDGESEICNDGCEHPYSSPYGQPGDRLWVKETGWERPLRTAKMLREGADTWAPYYFDADGLSKQDAEDFKNWGFKRRPSIFMPRAASRIDLDVTAVRVERLQDISEADAIAEGVSTWRESWDLKTAATMFLRGTQALVATNDGSVAQRLYHLLWEQINGAGSWAANPWVWVVEFRRIRP